MKPVLIDTESSFIQRSAAESDKIGRCRWVHSEREMRSLNENCLADGLDLAAYARELGFVACGVASLESNGYGEALDRWLGAGYAGTMRYLHRQARKRKAPVEIVAGATSAVVVLENYLPAEGVAKSEERGARGEGQVLSLIPRLSFLSPPPSPLVSGGRAALPGRQGRTIVGSGDR